MQLWEPALHFDDYPWGKYCIFIKREIEQKLQRAFLGFAAGVMLAASLWSLLIPATEGAQEAGQIGWLPAAGGFLLGGLFLFGLDILVRRLRSKR